jgi:DNA-binding LacI/PurR family transcriptional regulator
MFTETEEPITEEPIYRRIQSVLRARIAGGDWKVGQALPGRQQLCAEFGTTRVTLDKAIQGLVSAGLLRSSKGVGTFVARADNAAAAGNGPSPRRPLRIGVIVEHNSDEHHSGQYEPVEDFDDNFYFGLLFQGVRNAFSGKSVDSMFAHLHRTQYKKFYQENALDGMILMTPSLEELPTLRHLAASGIPFVAVGISSDDPADAELPCIDTDNQQGARDAVQHLLDLGHRRIAIVNLATSGANHHERLVGYRQTMAAAAVPVEANDLVLFPSHNAARFEERIEQWLAKAQAAQKLPTAIFSCDYLMTLATLRVLRRHGLCVPDDISVVGFDNPLSAAHLTPPLTAVRQPVYQLGLRAANRLMEALLSGGRPEPGVEILRNELIVRESTGPLLENKMASV